LRDRARAALFFLGAAASVALSACHSAAPPVDPGCGEGSVIALGDSITFGAGLPSTESYPGQLSLLLGSPVCNAGVNGDTAKNGLARLQRDVLQFHPTAVVILFGTNDSGVFAAEGKQQVPLGDFKRNLDGIVKAVAASGATPLLATLPPMNAPLLQSEQLRPEHWAEYDAAIRSSAAADDVTLVDLSKAFGGNLSLLQDGIHPTAAGAALIARAIYAALKASAPGARAVGKSRPLTA
jgi:lysophospholipase L1-like esterase